MVQATLDPRWINKSQCPLAGVIKQVEPYEESFKGRNYQSFRLTLATEEGVYTYDAKFRDKNALINFFGSNTDTWLEKKICITLSPEGWKQISLVLN